MVDCSIIIPVLNQDFLTKQCVDTILGPARDRAGESFLQFRVSSVDPQCLKGVGRGLGAVGFDDGGEEVETGRRFAVDQFAEDDEEQ